MKKKFLDIEFLKGDLTLIENQIIETEKHYIQADTYIQEGKSYLRKLYQVPLLEYRKIQIHNLGRLIKKLEFKHNDTKRQFKLIYKQIDKLKDTEIMDAFSKSVENNVIKTIKSKYTLKPKYSKEKIYYYIFKLKNTLYCIQGRLESVFLFKNKNDLIKYLEPFKKNSIVFPDFNNLTFFLPKDITSYYIAKISKKKDNQIYYIIFYKKILCKENIEHLTLYELNDIENGSIIKSYFLHKGKKIYML